MGCSSSTNVQKPHLLRGLRLTLLHSIDNKECLFDFEDVKKLEEICIENSEAFQEIDHAFIKCKPSISETHKKCLDFFTSSNTDKSVLQLAKSDEDYEFLSCTANSVQNKNLNKQLWVVLRKNTLSDINKHELKIDDVIRIGKFTFHVRDIYIKRNLTRTPKFTEIKANCENQSNICCRVCLNEEESPENPLIAPCGCKGSMKYIHFECAQKWFYEKYVNCTQTENVLIYAWRDSHCELCNQNMELNHTINGQKRHLMALSSKKGSYILFESVFPDEKQKNYLIYIILSTNNETLIGRTASCHLKIDDLTISKQHAKIVYENGKAFIEDLKSRCGTLILFRNNLVLGRLPQRIVFQLKTKLLVFSNYY